MPKFHAVLGGAPLGDKERPCTLPAALEKTLAPHEAKLGSVRACGETGCRWGTGEGPSHALAKPGSGVEVPDGGVWIATMDVPHESLFLQYFSKVLEKPS